MFDAGLQVQAKFEKKSIEDLKKQFLSYLFDNISPAVVREMLKHDLKSSSEPRQIKQITNERLESDMKTLKRLAREEKRPNLELMMDEERTYAHIGQGISMLSDSELDRLGDLTARMMHSDIPFDAALKTSLVDRLLMKNNFILQIAIKTKHVSANMLTELLSHPKQPLSYIPTLLTKLEVTELNKALNACLIKFLELSRDPYFSEQNKKDKQYN